MLKQYRELDMTPSDINKANAMERQNIEDAIKQYHLDDKKVNQIPKKELRLVLLGKTGAGKSATGNMILGEEAFVASHSATSCTKTIKSGEVTVGGVQIRVIDTPGLCDTSITEKGITTEIAKICKKREEAAREYDKCIRNLIPRINSLLIKKFERKVIGEIEQMEPVDDKAFCADVFEKVKPLVKGARTTDSVQQESEEKQLREAIDSQFKLMKERLTSPAAKVKEFILDLMCAAEVMLQPVVKTGIMWLIGAAIKAIKS